jgi:hypothetical protein
MFANWIAMNVRKMFVAVCGIPKAMVAKSFLPYIHVRCQLRCGSMRKSSFDELDCLLQRASGCNQGMEVIGHYDKRMKLVGLCTVVVKGVNEEPGPRFGAKQCTASPSSRRNHIRLLVVSRWLALRSHVFLSG